MYAREFGCAMHSQECLHLQRCYGTYTGIHGGGAPVGPRPCATARERFCTLVQPTCMGVWDATTVVRPCMRSPHRKEQSSSPVKPLDGCCTLLSDTETPFEIVGVCASESLATVSTSKDRMAIRRRQAWSGGREPRIGTAPSHIKRAEAGTTLLGRCCNILRVTSLRMGYANARSRLSFFCCRLGFANTCRI